MDEPYKLINERSLSVKWMDVRRACLLGLGASESRRGAQYVGLGKVAIIR